MCTITCSFKSMKIIFCLFLLIFYTKFYFLETFYQFNKGRTTISTTTEPNEILDQINILICFDPIFKPSIKEKYSIKRDVYDLLDQNKFSNNQSRLKIFQELSYRNEQDFTINTYKYTTWPQYVKVNFEMFEIATFRHGLCTLIKPIIDLGADDTRIIIDITLSPNLSKFDQPKHIEGMFISDNGWSGITLDDWLIIKPKTFKFPIRTNAKSENFFKLSQIDHKFINGVDDFDECYRNYLKKKYGNCKKCFALLFNYWQKVPECVTYNDFMCITYLTVNFNRQERYNCLQLKQFVEINAEESNGLVFNGNGTGVLLIGYNMKHTKTVKEEIYVITTEQFIGSIGGSLGLFLGFSFFTFFTSILDRIHSYLLNNLPVFVSRLD